MTEVLGTEEAPRQDGGGEELEVGSADVAAVKPKSRVRAEGEMVGLSVKRRRDAGAMSKRR